jgi:electron transfer flavoprotein alpha subunit
VSLTVLFIRLLLLGVTLLVALLTHLSSLFPFTFVRVSGLKKVHFSKDKKYQDNLAEPLAPLIKSIVESNNYTHVFAGHTAVGRDIIPRVSALLDSSQISDIIAVESEDTFQRPIYAGNALLTIKSKDKIKVITVRGTAFEAAAEDGGSAEKSEVKAADGDCQTSFVEEKLSKSSRPDLGTAPRVVSGGRALKSGEVSGARN